jgi:hypothetical protein
MKQVCAWTRFQLYLLSIGLQDDPYLDSFNRAQWIKILSTFAHSIREGRYGIYLTLNIYTMCYTKSYYQ